MIEKRTMWRVDCIHEIAPVSALFDTEKQELITYQYEDDDEFYILDEGEKAFCTKTEAETYVEERRAYLISKMAEVKSLLEEMDQLSGTCDFQFSREDYLPGTIMENCKGSYYDEYCNKKQVISILRVAIGQRILCIAGDSVPIDRVNKICWYRDHAELYLESDNRQLPLVTTDSTEMEAVKVLFGGNVSNKVHGRGTI